MTYGLPYMGSKSSIADWVLAHLPVADTFVDLFAGGCAVTHAALLSGRYRHVIANDVQGDVPALFRDALHGILPPDYLHAITREEFHMRKTSSPYIRLVWSFGNNAKDYIWGEDVERIKLLAHSMLCEDSLSERHRMYGAFYSALVDLLRARPDDKCAESIQSIEQIKRILSLRSPVLAERLTVSAASYDEVCPPSKSVVYADPPYRGTAEYAVAFDFDRFDSWLRSTPFPVYISEYTMPPDFVCIASTEKNCTLSASTNAKKTTERLFLHERWTAGLSFEQELFL